MFVLFMCMLVRIERKIVYMYMRIRMSRPSTNMKLNNRAGIKRREVQNIKESRLLCSELSDLVRS